MDDNVENYANKTLELAGDGKIIVRYKMSGVK